MNKFVGTLAAAAMFAPLFPGQALAQTPMYGANITLDQAKKCLAAAEAESRKNNWMMAIAVLDTGGHMVAFEKIDGTQVASIGIAIEKAKTANNFKRPSKVFEDAVKDRPAVLSLGAMTIEGGLPILINSAMAGTRSTCPLSPQWMEMASRRDSPWTSPTVDRNCT